MARQVAKSLDLKNININSYLLYLPKNYEDSRLFPTIIFLHGAGERGVNINDLKRTGLPQKLESEKDFPFIVISPQCLPKSYWNIDMLNDFLDEVLQQYKIDRERLYLTGLSMGGYGTWLWAINNPEKFAAIAPICGGGSTKEVHKLRGLPIWTFHGAKDEIVPISESVKMVKALEDNNIQVKFTIYPDAKHDSWTETYNNPELYSWFLNHTRRPVSN